MISRKVKLWQSIFIALKFNRNEVSSMKKRVLSLLLALGLCAAMVVPAAAKDNSIKQVEAGYLVSLIVTNGGDLYGCGATELGGHGYPVSYPLGTDAAKASGDASCYRPRLIAEGVEKVASSKSPSSQAPGSIASGGHSLILMKNGDLYGLGDNYCGQLGKGDRQQHPGLQYMMSGVKDISCTGTASFFITNSGDLYWCGLMMQQNSANAQYIFEPSPVKVLSNVKDVEGGAEHVAVLKTDGTVWTMGCAYGGGLGNGVTNGFSSTFIQAFSGAASISAGDSYTMALKADGSLYGWGNNSCGQIGINFKTASMVTSPTRVMTGVKSVECGYNITHVIKTDNTLWNMGWNYHGGMGLGEPELASIYTPQKALSGVAAVSGGYLHTLALKSDGSMVGCGQSSHGELGTGKSIYEVFTWISAGLTASPILEEGALPFTDVAEDAYYYDAVQWAVHNYITTGTTATTFSPYSTCTRAQIIAFLWRAAENSTLYVTEWIDDVDAGDWFFSAVRWAVQEGMIPNSGKFYPYKPCTRAATVEFMWKAAGSPSYDVSKLPFTDVKASASYAQAVAWALDKGVTTGTTATTFSPTATCTRAQIATFLYRAFA